MFAKSVMTAFFLASLTSASPHQQRQTSSGVVITDLNQNVTTTGGSGNVAAAGTLSPFGGIGVGR